MNKVLATKRQDNLLYLLEIAPVSELILDRQVVKDRLENIFYECARELGFEIDSCDVLFDFVAITLYVKSSVNIETLVMNLKKKSSDTLIKEFAELKQFAVDGSLWDEDCEIELLS